MSMGGAEASAPPIFLLVANSKTCHAPCGQELLYISCNSVEVEEKFREKTLPCRAIADPGVSLHPGRDLDRSSCLRGAGSRSCFTSQKEVQIQEAQIQEGQI
jgi:hypothetical protein